MYILCYNIGYHTEEDGETVLADEFGKAEDRKTVVFVFQVWYDETTISNCEVKV